MKKQQSKDLRTKDLKALTKLAQEKKLEYYKALSEIKAGKEKNLKKAKFIKKELAQIKTIETEKRLAESENK